MPISADIKADPSGLDRLLSALARDIFESRSPAMQQGLRQSSFAYLAGVRADFVQNSKGGGAWEGLRPYTKLRRAERDKLVPPRSGRRGATALQRVASMHFAIGYDKGDLFRSLIPGAEGNVERLVPGGIDVGSIDRKLPRFAAGGSDPDQVDRPVFNDPAAPTLERIRSVLWAAVDQTIRQLTG